MARFDRTIPPGGEGKITLEVKTKGYQGNVNKSARIFSNDPNKPQLTISMKGNIWTPIRISPRSVHLGGGLGDKIEKVVNLESKKKEPLTLKLASVSIAEKIGVELKETEKGRKYQLVVKNLVQEEGRYRGQVKLTTNYSEKPEIVIRVSGHVRAPVEVKPKSLNFGRMPQERLQKMSKDGRLVRRPVMVILNKGNDLRIERTKLEKSLFKVVVKETKDGRVFQLMVEPILEKLKKGKNTDRLTIHTNHKDRKVLEVPISLEVL